MLKNLVPAVLAVLACAILASGVRAQDFVDEELLPAQNDSRIGSIFNAPDPATHLGLLGKVFLQQRYEHLGVSDSDVRQVDKSIQGFSTLANLPVMTLDLPTPIDFDVFFGYSNVGLKGSANSGPPLNVPVYLNAKLEGYAVGTTIYPTLAESFRPFAQLGAVFSRTDADIALGFMGANIVDHDTRFLANVGFEYDLLDAIGYRMTLHLETKDRFQDSIITNDLILWPHDKIFVRGGLATSLDGGGIGFTIGGGLAF